jgi:hypothetical protein
MEEHFAGLLSGGDDERRFVGVGRGHGAHGVAQSRRGVQVDQHGFFQTLGQAVGDAHDAGFLEGEDVGEIFWQVLEKGFFGGARIADDGRQLQAPQQLEGDVADSRHGVPPK